MSFIQTTPPAEAEGAVASMYRHQQAHWGYVPNYAKVFCHRPEVMARWGELLAEIKRPLDLRRFELATFTAALELRNSACALGHGRALRAFFADDEIAALAEGRLDGVLDPAEQAIVGFARQVARDASRVGAGDIGALEAVGLSAAEIFDIAAAVAARAFFTKLLDALGVQMDAPFLAFDAAMRGLLRIGRPIDPAPPQKLPDEEPATAGAADAR
jgi:alkylhydroperoxidase family enzyme